jgi:hypothetical protein
MATTMNRKDAIMLSSRIRRTARAWCLLALGVGLGACSENTPCDDGLVLRGGYCYPADAAVAPADAAVAPADVAAAEAGAAFGQICGASSECAAPATYCAIQPGQSSGFCTAFGCDQNPSICPAAWICMDLTPYGLAAHMCSPSQ